MSITATGSVQERHVSLFEASSRTPRAAQGKADAFAAFEAPSPNDVAQPAIGQGATVLPVTQPAIGQGATAYGASDIPSPASVALQDKVGLFKKSEQELKTLLQRAKHDPSLLSTSAPAGWAVFNFVVSETKKSGTYGLLQQAAIDRLKTSGNYESLIRQVLDLEEAHGRSRDRTWAENWIERQFDFDKVDADIEAGQPYFEPLSTYGMVRPSHNDEGGFVKGSAVFLGNKTDVQARGQFKIQFTGTAERPFYTVKNVFTDETTAPLPFDSRGTVITMEGLRAEMFGAPAPGDVFHIYKPVTDNSQQSEYRIGYHDDFFRPTVKDWKMNVFNNVFGPFIDPNGTKKRPSEIINDFVASRQQNR